jgi:MFS transporter, ACS family, hexuronate transporter
LLNQHVAIASHAKPAGRYRWTIVALLFFATTINYLDRQVISLLKEDYLDKEFKWTESDYSNIVICFQIAYAAGLLLAGWFIDYVGAKKGYAISIILWSVAAILHGFAGNTAGFMAARAFLGVSEAGNFPAAIKTVTEWFPKRERALATGLFNSGSNIGAVFAPLTVPLIAVALNWQWAFILTGLVGFVWLFFWFRLYELPRRHKKLSAEELAYIESDQEEAVVAEPGVQEKKVPWFQLLSYRQTWAFVIGKFLTDPIWWFYLFWLPSFLKNEYGLTKTDIALPIAMVYVMAMIGSILGGWLSGYFIKKGVTAFVARRRTLFIFALFALPVMLAQYAGSINMWLAIVIIGTAAAGHQGFSANIFTTVSDMFPKKAVASVVGIGGMAGASGGILLAWAAGRMFDHYKGLGKIETGYFIMFIICSLAYLTAVLIMKLLTPRFKEIKL